MAASRQIFRSASHSYSSSSSSSPIFKFFLRYKTTSSITSSHHQQHEHEYSKPCHFLGSWNPPKDPKEAEAKLGKLRRDYGKQVKELRKEYLYEMELQRQERQRKDEAKKEAIRVAKEERKAAKAEMAKARAAERKIVEEEFRQTLMKERAQNLENWRLKEKMREEKKSKKSDVLRQKSSIWIDEADLVKKIDAAIVDSHPL